MRRLLRHLGRQGLRLSGNRLIVRAQLCLLTLSVGLSAGATLGQERIEPVYSIWEVVLGQPAAQIPEAKVSEIACGTNGGPHAQPLVPQASSLTLISGICATDWPSMTSQMS